MRAFYAINAVVWLAVSPLVAAHYHTVSPIALLIGPPMTVLTSLALLTGFAFLLFSWCFPLAWLFAALTQASLYGCEVLVIFGQQLPGAYFFVTDVPTGGCGFSTLVTYRYYFGIRVASCALGASGRRRLAGARHRAATLAASAGRIALHVRRRRPRGCTVIETPNGRVIVYDAGATTGPDVTRRHIAPFSGRAAFAASTR